MKQKYTREQYAMLIGELVLLGIGIAFLVFAPAIYKAVNGSEVPTSETTTETTLLVDLGEELTPATAYTEPAPVELDPAEVELLARTIWGEAGGVKSETERAAVAWCVLNRVELNGSSIEAEVTKPGQYIGYRATGECPDSHMELAADVLERWTREQNGEQNVGRVLPTTYLFFTGDGSRNYFTKEWRDGEPWDWSNISPYNT